MKFSGKLIKKNNQTQETIEEQHILDLQKDRRDVINSIKLQNNPFSDQEIYQEVEKEANDNSKIDIDFEKLKEHLNPQPYEKNIKQLRKDYNQRQECCENFKLNDIKKIEVNVNNIETSEKIKINIKIDDTKIDEKAINPFENDSKINKENDNNTLSREEENSILEENQNLINQIENRNEIINQNVQDALVFINNIEVRNNNGFIGFIRNSYNRFYNIINTISSYLGYGSAFVISIICIFFLYILYKKWNNNNDDINSRLIDLVNNAMNLLISQNNALASTNHSIQYIPPITTSPIASTAPVIIRQIPTSAQEIWPLNFLKAFFYAVATKCGINIEEILATLEKNKKSKE